MDDEVAAAEPSAEVRERQRQLEELEDTLAHRLLEVGPPSGSIVIFAGGELNPALTEARSRTSEGYK